MNFIFKIGFVKWLLILSAFFTLLEATVNTFPEDLFKYTHCKINNAYYIVPLSRYDITQIKIIDARGIMIPSLMKWFPFSWKRLYGLIKTI